MRLFLCLILISTLLVGISRAEEPADDASPPAQIDFAKQIMPLLTARCATCHAHGELKGGFSLKTRDDLLTGGESGPAIVVGQSDKSLLIELVSGADPDWVMPPQGKPLMAAEVQLLRDWIDQNARWPQELRIGKTEPINVEPRRPDVPIDTSGRGLSNPIDRFLQTTFEQRKIESSTVVSDNVFARRASLDLVGLLPTPQELDTFVADKRANKRALWVRRLLDNRQAYATHWLNYWNDLLRNAYRGTGFIDDGRRQITSWLYQSLYDNKPYDQFVHELVSPVEGSEGFVRGIIWRGVVNASQRRELQAAQNIGQVLLGTNLKCASCHDSFINDWKLTDAYGLAAVFADEPLEIHRCDRGTGETAEIKFLFPGFGTVDAEASRTERMKQLADLLTSPANGRLTRTVVNRLWERFFGRGLIEPLDEMDNEPWNRNLLDWLATDLADHGYDVQQTIERICTSRAYQLPAVGAPGPETTDFEFRGPLVRRMSAEQFADAVSTLTGNWNVVSSLMLKKDGRGQGGQMLGLREIFEKEEQDGPTHSLNSARWIWVPSDQEAAEPKIATETGAEAELATDTKKRKRVFLRKAVTLDEAPQRAVAVVSCVDSFVLYVNNKRVGGGNSWSQPTAVDLSSRLVGGDNVIAVETIPPKNNKKKPKAVSAIPKAFFFMLVGQQADDSGWTLGSDGSWLWSDKETNNWRQPGSSTEGWIHTKEIGPASAEPWKLEPRLIATLRLFDVPIRASQAMADPLLRALGRPNREQVVTRRDSWATMLQTLELTNGGTLDEILKKGAARWLNRNEPNNGQLIADIYRSALGRTPTPVEQATAEELVGTPATVEGVQDLLWILAMLPEFQLIY